MKYFKVQVATLLETSEAKEKGLLVNFKIRESSKSIFTP
jgi:hypothetical protein